MMSSPRLRVARPGWLGVRAFAPAAPRTLGIDDAGGLGTGCLSAFRMTATGRTMVHAPGR